MNKHRTLKEERHTNLTIVAVYCFTAAMIGVFPLFYKNNYIDIISAKKEFFLIASGLLIVFAGITVICKLARKYVVREDWATKEKKAVLRNITDVFLLIFLVGILLSTLLSKNRWDAFWAESGRQLGASMLLAGILVYYILKRWLKPTMLLVWIFLISNSMVFLLVVLNTWNIDPLGMYQNLIVSQQDDFISTMGNLNINAGYVCMVLPVLMVMFLLSETNRSKWIYGAVLILGALAMVCCRSDSAILGMGTALFVLLWFACESWQKIVNWLALVLLFNMALLALTILDQISGMGESRFDGAQGWILDLRHLVPVGFVLLLLLFFVSHMQQRRKDYTRQLKQFRNCFFGFVVGAGILILVTAVIVNILGEDRVGSGILGKLILTDSFGTNRGYIWKRTLSAYGTLPLWQKITGIGMNHFGGFINAAYGTEMAERLKAPYIDAHNEFLQFLVTTGFAGVAGYFGILISAFIRYVRKLKEQPLLLMAIAVICAYLAQGLVNNPQVFTTPLLFVYLGIAESLYQQISE